MRVIEFTSGKRIEDVEREMLNSLQFIFGIHFPQVFVELERKVVKGDNYIYFFKYRVESGGRTFSGKLTQITLSKKKEKWYISLQDEPVVVLALVMGISRIADSISVFFGGKGSPARSGVRSSRHTVNTAIVDALGKIVINEKSKPLLLTAHLTDGDYIVVYFIRGSLNDILGMFNVVFEAVVGDDVTEIGIDRFNVGKAVRVTSEEAVKLEEEFVVVREPYEIEKRLESRRRK